MKSGHNLFNFLVLWKIVILVKAQPFLTPKIQNIIDDINIHDVKGYPVLEAFLASGFLHDRLSLEEMASVYKCTGSKDELQEYVSNVVPKIIDNAIYNADRNRGRILEYTEEKFDIGENYVVKLKGVALPCIVTRPFRFEGGKDGAATYAAHMVASTIDLTDNADPLAYNVSLIINADVVELGNAGLLYVPKDYCLDVGEQYDFGITLPGSDTLALNAEIRRTRTVPTGSTTAVISTYRNIVSWLRNTQRPDDITVNAIDQATGNVPRITIDTFGPWIKEAFLDPKLEVIAIIEAIQSEDCETLGDCRDLARTRYASRGITLEAFALEAATLQVLFMIESFHNWNHWKNETGQTLNLFTTPLVFHPNLATTQKNSGFGIFSRQANPYFTSNELKQKVADLNGEGYEISFCVQDATNRIGDTSAVIASALEFPAALKRRINEFPTSESVSPLNTLGDWGLYGDLLDSEQTIWDFVNADSFSQEVRYDRFNRLQRGNLTQKIIGKSAEWIMATQFSDSTNLQNLLRIHMESGMFDEAAEEAFDVDNPCGNAARDIDIYLFILGMVTAACGGAQAVMSNVHYFLHWWHEAFCGSNNRSSTFGFLRLLPTYELLIAILGWVCFLALYIPVIFQVFIEREIVNFSSEGVDIEAFYASNTEIQFNGETKSMIVNLVHGESYCEAGRPQFIFTLLLVGLICGVIINTPFAAMTNKALCRYLKRIYHGEEIAPPNTSIRDLDLRIFMISASRRRYGYDDGNVPNGHDQQSSPHPTHDSAPENPELQVFNEV